MLMARVNEMFGTEWVPPSLLQERNGETGIPHRPTLSIGPRGVPEKEPVTIYSGCGGNPPGLIRGNLDSLACLPDWDVEQVRDSPGWRP